MATTRTFDPKNVRILLDGKEITPKAFFEYRELPPDDPEVRAALARAVSFEVKLDCELVDPRAWGRLLAALVPLRVKLGRGGRRKRARRAALEARREARRARLEAFLERVNKACDEFVEDFRDAPSPTSSASVDWARKTGKDVLADLLEAAEKIRSLPPAPTRVFVNGEECARLLAKGVSASMAEGNELPFSPFLGLPLHVEASVPDGEARVLYSDGHVERAKL